MVVSTSPTRDAHDASAFDDKVILNSDDVRRALTRIAHEIIERNHGLDHVVLVGIQRGGAWVAERLREIIAAIEPGVSVPVGVVDPTFHRDDIGMRPTSVGAQSHIPSRLDGAVVVLVDDVLFTGRTARAALNALGEFGRPEAVQLAVLIDRGHRELPLRADYVGKNLPTRRSEDVRVRLAEVDGGDDGVELWGDPE